MNCKQTQALLGDHLDGTLTGNNQEAVKNHLVQCEQCRQTEAELSLLLSSIDAYKEKSPDASLERRFNEMLQNEQSKLHKPVTLLIAKNKKLLRHVIRVAATILLILGSYFLGEHHANQRYKRERAWMKEEMAFSLMESSSASKRIQAVIYSGELDHANDKIIHAFIHMMSNDKHVNVRLAAANALAKYTENSLVIDALINRLKVEKNTTMQLELIQILIDIPDDRVLPTIRKLREDDSTPSYMKELIENQMSQLI